MISLLLCLFLVFQAATTFAGDATAWNEIAGVTEKEMAERSEIAQQAEQLLLSAQFDKLESLAKEFRTSKEEFSDGEWKLNVFYDGMSYYTRRASEKSWTSRLSKLRQWVQEKPKSITARVALAECLVGYAFFGRSHGWAKDVTEEQWKLFDERLNEAARVLHDAKGIGGNCPQYLAALQRVALEGWNRQEYEKLFERAVASEPRFNVYYFRKALILLPRWFGEPGEWERFAEASADRVDGASGDMLYARIVWFLDRWGPCKNLRERPKTVDWDRMEHGLEAIQAGKCSRAQ